MKINLWYSKSMSQWRWTLYTEEYNKNYSGEQHSGSQPDLRVAMNDVANTVEYILESKQSE